MEFEAFPKIARLKREIVITEKIDGTNACVALHPIDSETELEHAEQHACMIFPAGMAGDSPVALYAGSRTRWIKPGKGTDNFGFAQWVQDNAIELISLGPGRHFGEWWGQGIQRGYGLNEKRFSLFNVARWNADNPNRPACCGVVPLLAKGEDADPDAMMHALTTCGSVAAPGFMNAEGIVVYHSAARTMFKVTMDDREKFRAEAA